MNSQLLNNRPEDSSAEEFKKVWENSGYALTALYNTILQWSEENNKVKKDDFDCPNHYAKLAYQAGLIQAYKQVLDLLPASAKPN